KERAGTLDCWRVPDIGRAEDVRVVKARGSIVHLVAVGIVEWKSRVPGVEAGNALTKWEIVQTLGVSVVGQERESVRHAFFHGSLQRMIASVDVGNVGLNRRRKGVGLEGAAAAD